MVKEGDTILIMGDNSLVPGKSPAVGDTALILPDDNNGLITHVNGPVKSEDSVIIKTKFNGEIVEMNGAWFGNIWVYGTCHTWWYDFFGRHESHEMSKIVYDYNLEELFIDYNWAIFDYEWTPSFIDPSYIKYERPYDDNIIIFYHGGWNDGGYDWVIVNPENGEILNRLHKDYPPRGFYYDNKFFFIREMNYCKFNICEYNEETHDFNIIDTVDWIGDLVDENRENPLNVVGYPHYGVQRFCIIDGVVYIHACHAGGEVSSVAIDIYTGDQVEKSNWVGFRYYDASIPLIAYDVHDETAICNSENGLDDFAWNMLKDTPFNFNEEYLTGVFGIQREKLYIMKVELQKRVKLICNPTYQLFGGYVLFYSCIVGNLVPPYPNDDGFTDTEEDVKNHKCIFDGNLNVINPNEIIDMNIDYITHFLEYNNIWIFIGTTNYTTPKLVIIDLDEMELKYVYNDTDLNCLNNLSVISWFVHNDYLYIGYNTDTGYSIDVIDVINGKIVYSNFISNFETPYPGTIQMYDIS